MTKHQAGPKSVLNGTALAVSTNGDYTVCEQLDRVIYDIVWANGSSLNATITIQKSHDLVTWFDLDLSSTLALSGTSGDYNVIIKEITWKYIRPIITFVAGNCNLLTIVKGTVEGA